MAEITVNQLIKIIIGVFVVVVVVGGIYMVFKGKIIYFFKNIPTGNNSIKLFLSLIQ